MWKVLCSTGALLLGLMVSRAAGQVAEPACRAPSSMSVRASADRAARRALDRPVTMTVKNVPLVDALRVLDRQAGLRLGYTDRVLPTGKQVSLVADRMPARQALASVLKGTGLVARLSPTGQLIIVRQVGPSEQRQAAVAKQAVFAVRYRSLREGVGRMRDKLKRRCLSTDQADRVLKGIEALQEAVAHNDKAKADYLENAVIEELKTLEFMLSRKTKQDVVWPVFGGNSDVPTEYRTLVAKYYKSLADRR